MAEDYKSNYIHTAVSGALNQQARSYWRLALPALGTRYIARYAQNLVGSKSNSFFDAAAGTWMLGMTAYYAYRSEEDLKRIFSETVAYEFDKKPSEVGFTDLFKSNNKAIITTHKHFLLQNTIRTAVNSTFFACFLPWERFQKVDSVDLGVGLNGAYMVYDILGHGNSTTFFEQLQHFLSNKIDQKNSLGANVNAADLMQLYDSYAKDNDKQNVIGEQADSGIWKHSDVIFGRMAELMNQTYQRKYNGEASDFVVPKFLYLLGNNLIQPKKPEQTLAYIEVANRYGMHALKKMVRSINDGMELTTALQKYPVLLPVLQDAAAPATGDKRVRGTGTEIKPEPSGSYTDKISRTNGTLNIPTL